MGSDDVDLKIDEAKALESSWDDVPSEPRLKPQRDTSETEFDFKMPGSVNRIIDDVVAELVPKPTMPAAKPSSRAAPPAPPPIFTPAWGMTPPATSARPIPSAPPPPPPIGDDEETPLFEAPTMRPESSRELPPPRRVHPPPPTAPPPLKQPSVVMPAGFMTAPELVAPVIPSAPMVPAAPVSVSAPMIPPISKGPTTPPISPQSLVADLRSVSIKPTPPPPPTPVNATPAAGLMRPSVPIVPDRPTMLIDGESVALEHLVAKAAGQKATIEVPSVVITGSPVSLLDPYGPTPGLPPPAFGATPAVPAFTSAPSGLPPPPAAIAAPPAFTPSSGGSGFGFESAPVLEPGMVIAQPQPQILRGTPAAQTPAELKRVDLSAGLLDLVPNAPARSATAVPKPVVPVRAAPSKAFPPAPSKPAPWWKPFGLGIAAASLLWLILRLLN
jgi:hypothetical protein